VGLMRHVFPAAASVLTDTRVTLFMELLDHTAGRDFGPAIRQVAGSFDDRDGANMP